MDRPPSLCSLYRLGVHSRDGRLRYYPRRNVVVGAFLPHPASRFVLRILRSLHSCEAKPDGEAVPGPINGTRLFLGSIVALLHGPGVYGPILDVFL